MKISFLQELVSHSPAEDFSAYKSLMNDFMRFEKMQSKQTFSCIKYLMNFFAICAGFLILNVKGNFSHPFLGVLISGILFFKTFWMNFLNHLKKHEKGTLW